MDLRIVLQHGNIDGRGKVAVRGIVAFPLPLTFFAVEWGHTKWEMALSFQP